MPKHDEVLEFARKVADASGYSLASDVELSRVALVSRDGAIKALI
jgi:tRNA wybutosine-synthesizing protein 1